MWCWLMYACATSPPDPVVDVAPVVIDPATKKPAADPVPHDGSWSVQSLKTKDGIALEADVYQGAKDAPGVILMHMIPPHYERSSWPKEFLEELTKPGWHVCVPDRRGAGKSKGEAQEAYDGPHGKNDVAACVDLMKSRGMGRFSIIGASNGTTSMLDYAHWASESKAEVPAGPGFMTGGQYTEKQTDVIHAEAIPAIFTYSSKEREWSAKLKDVSKKWEFHEYPSGDHGTKMFEKKPMVTEDLVRFLHNSFRPPQ